MTINSRNKGASAERELAGLLFDQLGVKLVRNLEQYRSKGYDLIPESGSLLDAYAIEVKRYAKISNALMKGFWLQAVNQAERVGKIPLLFFRADREDWRSIIPLHRINQNLSTSTDFDNTATLSIEALCQIMRECD